MDLLSPELFPEILAFLRASDIGRVAACGRAWHRRVHAAGALSDTTTYRKVVSATSPLLLTDHFLYEKIPGTSTVTFRFCPWTQYPDALARKMLVQLLTLNDERDAVLWLSTPLLRRADGNAVFFFRHVPWDFVLYSIACRALAASPRPIVHLHILSVPAIEHGGARLASSAQPFLCHFLGQAKGKALHLHVEGIADDVPHVPLTPEDLDVARRSVDVVMERPNWAMEVDLYGAHDFRSSSIGLGTALQMANPNVRTLVVKNYAFDELHHSMDVSSMVTWLRTGAHSLTRVHLHGLTFSTGSDFCDLLRALCDVASLQTLHLQTIEHLTEAPVDPLVVLFEEGGHIKDMRLGNVMRTQTDIPFMALHTPGPRCLGLTRMFLDAESVRPLMVRLARLPNLKSLDLSCNGIDGRGLALFGAVLKDKRCCLQRLKLSSNILTNVSVVVFCDALAINRTLHHLDLSDNFLGTYGCLSLIQTVLVENTFLKYMSLDCNQARIRMEDLYRVVLLMRHGDASPPFRQLSLRSNPIFFERRHDEDMYTYFFATEFNVSLKF